MQKKIYLKILFVLVFLNSSIYALNWSECVRIARENNPSLKSSQENIEQANMQKKIVQSNLYPNLSLNSNETSSQNITTQGPRIDSYSYGLSLTQLLFDAAKTKNQVNAQETQVQIAKLNYDLASSNLRYNLKNAFINLKDAEDKINLSKKILERRQQNKQIIEASYKIGKEHKGALIQAEADVLASITDLKQAILNKQLAIDSLSAQLNVSISSNVIIEFEDNFNRDTNIDFEALTEITPQVKSQILLKKSMGYGLSAAVANYFPKFTANAGIKGTDDFSNSPEHSWNFGFNMTWSIYSGNQLKSQVKNARSELNQADQDLISTRNTVLYSLKQAWTNLEILYENVSVLKKYLEAAQERERISQAQYSTGLINFDNWTIIEANLVEAEKKYLSSKTALYQGENTWMKVIGITLETSF